MGTIIVGLGNTGGTATPSCRTWSDGTTDWRECIRGGNFCRDKTLTATGFDGVEGIDWENTYEES